MGVMPCALRLFFLMKLAKYNFLDLKNTQDKPACEGCL